MRPGNFGHECFSNYLSVLQKNTSLSFVSCPQLKFFGRQRWKKEHPMNYFLSQDIFHVKKPKLSENQKWINKLRYTLRYKLRNTSKYPDQQFFIFQIVIWLSGDLPNTWQKSQVKTARFMHKLLRHKLFNWKVIEERAALQKTIGCCIIAKLHIFSKVQA